MSVQIIVLTSGEKVIGNIEKIEDGINNTMLVKKPLAIKEMVTEHGLSYILLPFLPIKSDSIVVRTDNVAILPVDADPRIADQYQAQTSSLVLPTGNKIEKPTLVKWEINMEIKLDFVTNISSTNFVVWGTYKDWDRMFYG